jgi:drug/metabolite transporter (DMT)-like permease
VTVLMVVLTYPLLFSGATRVGSGLAAVINLPSLPVALLAIAVALDEEPWSARRAGAIGCGVLGLALLFAPRIAGGVGGAAGEAAGAAAILLSALAYALGSVAARPLLRAYRPGVVAAWTMLAGGAVVTAGAVAFEPGAAAALDGRWGAAAWASWAFLVLFGSLLAHVIYLRLVREWGASRAGAYAFVSPVVAVLLGALVYGERPGAWEAAGTAIMLSAAYSALREDQGPAAAPRHEEGHACRSTRVA